MGYNNFIKIFLLILLSLQTTIFQCRQNDIFNIINSNQWVNPNQYRIFITSELTAGDMSFQGNHPNCAGLTNGLDKANCVCQEIASTNNLENSQNYKAWLSDDTTDAICNIINIKSTQSSGCSPSSNFEYIDLFENLLFYDWNQIGSGSSPNLSITTTENGSTQNQTNRVWTGSYTGGISSRDGSIALHCNAWSSADSIDQGFVGDFTDSTQWTSLYDSVNPVVWPDCSNLYPIYCFEGP